MEPLPLLHFEVHGGVYARFMISHQSAESVISDISALGYRLLISPDFQLTRSRLAA